MKILLAEDDRSIQNLFVAIMESLGHTVIVAEDGLEGILKFNNHIREIDVVFTDYKMPRVNGGTFAHHCKTQRGDIPVVIITGYASDVTKENMNQVRVEHWLEKPVTMGMLKETLLTVEKQLQTKEQRVQSMIL